MSGPGGDDDIPSGVENNVEGAARIERGRRTFANLFEQNRETCLRCSKTVYPVEKITHRNGTIFHKSCFRCSVCTQHLTLGTALTNQTEASDKEIYCKKHAPVLAGAGFSFGADAVGISGALKIQQQVSESKMGQIQRELRGTDPGKAGAVGTDAWWIRSAMNAPKLAIGAERERTGYQGQFSMDSDAMFISGPLAQQLLRQGYSKDDLQKHHFPALIFQKREMIYKAQQELEAKQRDEESVLLEEILAKREKENEKIQEELDQEWESKIAELSEKFDREQKKKGRKLKDSEIKAMTVRLEQDKKSIEDDMKMKREQAQKHATMRLRQSEQEKTADMVKKHSEQMREVMENIQKEIAEELDEELKEVIGDEEGAKVPTGEQVLEELGVSVIRGPKDIPPPHPPSCKKKDLFIDPDVFADLDNYVISIAEDEQETFTDLVRKLTEHCLTDLEKVRAIFRWLTVKDLNVMEFSEDTKDTPMGLLRGIKFGTETYHVLFMRLCSYAGLHCVEVKGHSKSVGYEPGMHFDESMFTNTWNAVLVDMDWRLIQCNWGARHLIMNKKQKDQKQKEEEKRKSSNHDDKDANVEKGSGGKGGTDKKRDKIRYQYDEHYFLTDPDEFIQEFWPYQPEWQLLEGPLDLKQFEAQPFVRSVFFHYGMKFENNPKAVLMASENGGVEVRISVDERYAKDTVFHYQLRFANREWAHKTEVGGAKLERYVFQGMFSNQVLYNVYVPLPNEYFLEIFTNRIEDANKLHGGGGSESDKGAGVQTFRLKCACKFKIVCRDLQHKMHPLPNCATGEWGPTKAIRHFGLRPLTHEHGVINVAGGNISIQFQQEQPLQYFLKLRMNNTDDKELEKQLSHKIDRDIVTVNIKFYRSGQYGLDIYARAHQEGGRGSDTLAHACKYLLNVGQVNRDSQDGTPASAASTSAGKSSARDSQISTKSRDSRMSRESTELNGAAKATNGTGSASVDSHSPPTKVLPLPPGLIPKLGALPAFKKYGLKTVTPKDAKLHIKDANYVCIELGLTEPLFVTFQFLQEPEMAEMHDCVKLSLGERKVIFGVDFKQPGLYILAIFARRERDDPQTMNNVFNYSIRYGKDKTKSSIKK